MQEVSSHHLRHVGLCAHVILAAEEPTQLDDDGEEGQVADDEEHEAPDPGSSRGLGSL